MEVYVKQADNSEWIGIAEQVLPPSTELRYKGWRCLHQAEGGYPNPDHMPVVRPSLNVASVVFNQPMQLVSYSINGFNPQYSGSKWRSTYNGGIAFTNGNGFDDPRSGTRADYVNRKDLLSPLPKLMKAIICGGSFYTGKASNSLTIGLTEIVQAAKMSVGNPKALIKMKKSNNIFQAMFNTFLSLTSVNTLTMTPGIDAIDASVNHPSTQEWISTWAGIIIERHWYFHATTRAGDKINNFPQGVGNPVYIAYFLNKQAQYPLSWFERWWSNELPDPLKIYNT